MNIFDLPTFFVFAAFADGTVPTEETINVLQTGTAAMFLNFVAFALGATVGSFLNVCIYRIPLEQSVNDPKRSFCPSCKYAIPFYHNIPLVSWLLLRGKCANCKTPFSMRYWWVELLTAVVFLIIWRWVGGVENWQMAIVYWVFLAMLITATFIDFEHFIIPDGITIGGTIVGIVAGLAVPQIMGTGNHLHGLGLSALGATVGFGLLYAVVILGKIMFGRKTKKFAEPVNWKITQEGDDENPTLTVGDTPNPWEDIFFCGTEFMRLDVPEMELNGTDYKNVKVEVHLDHVLIDEERTELANLKTITGKTKHQLYSREAMGFGDVKFLAMIGAFLGWQAVLFTVFLASVAGTLVALPLRFIGKQEWSSRIPFGPYLALGGVVWLFFGKDLVDWYFGLLQSAREGAL